jgi:Ca2+-binding RTX toxin-like protein
MATINGTLGNDTLVALANGDILVGKAGNDIYQITDKTGVVITELLGEGIDTVETTLLTYTLTAANVENLTYTGTGNFNGTGSQSNNIITGAAGDDTLNGGLGKDVLIGGAGNDVYIVDTITDKIVEAAGGGTDTVRSSVNYTLGANIENLELTGTATNGTGNSGNNTITGNSSANILDGGSAGTDVLVGLGGNDTYLVNSATVTVTEASAGGTDTVKASVNYTLAAEVENLELIGFDDINGTGNDLNNIITGNFGNNQLNGGTGNDTLTGGTGDDIYIVDSTTDIINELADEGTDTVRSSVNYTLTASNVENIELTGTATSATGNTLNNVITGNANADTLNGGGGIDVLIGGAGDDTYVVDSVTDTITEVAGGGTDTIQSSVTYSLANPDFAGLAFVENLTLTGAAIINGTGNSLNNLIIGNTAANILEGLAGTDTLQGGAGDDTYIVDTTTDTITENAAAGTDTVQSSVSNTLAANVEKLILLTGATSGTGNGLANTITGNAAANTIDGGAGVDTLIGGTENDTYIVDNILDVVTETALTGSGTADLIQSSVNYTLSVNVENLELTGSNDLKGTGNIANNTITGNSGANELNGAAGIDTLIGLGGNDTYVIDSTTDTITEVAGGGTDLVQSSVTYTLAAEVENLTLTGAAIINGTGNSLANTITGNAAVNTLTGLNANDTLIGGNGNDIYIIDATTGYTITEAATTATNTLPGIADLVKASVNYTLTDNVENLELSGTATSGTGNGLANKITGTANADTLDGGVGKDTLIGGQGNDTYVVDNTLDVVTETALTGSGTADLIQSSVNYTLSVNVENLTLTGTAAIKGTGNNVNNTITGNAGDNTLNGGAGIDTLIGGNGNDTYIVDTTTDKITETSTGGTDLVQSSVTYTLLNNLENLTLTDAGVINGSGNGLDNIITGNASANTLNGNNGNDTLNGAGGNDIVNGAAGNDSLIGDSGNDILTGGTGVDTLTGGAGLDIFKYAASTEGIDSITDFVPADDTIQIVASTFEETLNLGVLTTDQFVLGAAAGTADHRFGYDSLSGALWFDADGNDTANALVNIATLSTGLTLTNNDIVII